MHCGDSEVQHYTRNNKNDWINCVQCQVWYRQNRDKISVRQCSLCTLRDEGLTLASESPACTQFDYSK